MASREIANLFVKLTAQYAQFFSETEKAGKSLKNLDKNVAKLNKAFGDLGKVLLGYISIKSIQALNRELSQLGKQGEALGSLKEGFVKLGGSFDQLEAARKSVLGTVDSLQLLSAANEGLVRGLPRFGEEFSKVTELAGRLANSLNGDVNASLQKVIQAISQGSETGLREVGILINQKKAWADYAASVGKATKDLSRQDKIMAMRVAAMDNLGEAIGRLAPMTDSFANAQEAVDASLRTGLATLGEQINLSEQLTVAYRGLSKGLDELDWESIGKGIAAVASQFAALTNIISQHLVPVISDFSRGIRVLFSDDIEAQAVRALKHIEEIEGAIDNLRNGWTPGALLDQARGGAVANSLEGQLKEAKAEYSKLIEKAKELKGEIGKPLPKPNAICGVAGETLKANEELKKLKEKWADFLQSAAEDDIGRKLKSAVDSLDSTSFENLKNQLSQAVQVGFVDKWADAIKGGAVSEADIRAQAAKAADIQVGEWSKRFEDKSEEAYKNSIDTWRSLFENAITGVTFNLEDALKQVAVGFAAQMAQSLLGSLGGLNISSAADLGGALASSLLGGGSGSTGIGSLLSSAGAATGIAGVIGSFGTTAAAAHAAGVAGPAMASGMFTSGTGILGALGPWGAAGIGAIALASMFGGDLFGGGPKNKETIARRDVIGQLEEALKGKGTQFFGPDGKMQPFNGNFILGSSGRFNDANWGDSLRSGNGQAFDVLGRGLTALLGVTEDIGPQIGKVLQENLNDNLNNARILVQELGIDQAQMEEQFVKMGEASQMSWHAVEVALQQVPQLFGEGLVAVGDFSAGFDQIIDSAGDGKDALLGIKNSAIEAAEAGITSFDQWKQSLLDAGKDAEYVDSFFKALEQRNLKTFEDIKNATTRLLGGVVADMESLSPALANVWATARDSAEELAETINGLPTSKDITLNVQANITPDARAVISATGGNVGSIPAFANGGIVSRPTLGLIGEAGPEAVVPLRSLSALSSNSSKGVIINVDARNAAHGVEFEVRRAIEEMSDIATASAMRLSRETAGRGSKYED